MTMQRALASSNRRLLAGVPLGFLALLLMITAAGQVLAAAAAGRAGGAYRMESGDVLSVTVFGEPDLSLESARVAADGSIAFPLLGDVAVQGLTARQVEGLLTRKLRDGYLKNPEVSVAVKEYRPYFVHGEIQKPGGYPYREGLTVEKAVVLAGGFTERASKRKIDLTREKAPNTPLHGVSLSTRVRPGDLIEIGESFF